MTDTQQLKSGIYLVYVGVVFWIAETAFFGWNMKPINEAERTCDVIAQAFMLAGIALRCNAVFGFVIKQIKEADNE